MSSFIKMVFYENKQNDGYRGLFILMLLSNPVEQTNQVKSEKN